MLPLDENMNRPLSYTILLEEVLGEKSVAHSKYTVQNEVVNTTLNNI